MNKKLIEKLYSHKSVEALVLGGSRATGIYDEKSDYDYYVYLNKPVSEEERRELLDEFMMYMEYSNQFWELEDDGIFKNNVEVEFIYRNLNDIKEMLDNLLVKGYVSHGYSTCFVDNLLNSKVVFDKTDQIEQMREKYRNLLTDDFYDKIITYNFPILMDKMPSLYYQVDKAIKRNDIFSINHRSTAFFEMYYDILFALNKVTHPGEKRLLEIALKLGKLPKDYKKNIEEYFSNLYVDNSKSLEILYDIAVNLHTLLTNEGYNFTIKSFK